MATWTAQSGYIPKAGYVAVFPDSALTVYGSKSKLAGKHIWACVRVDSDSGGWLHAWTKKGKPDWENWRRHVPKDHLEGFADSILKRVANEVGFNFSYRYPRDDNWGGLNHKTQDWNGIIREVLEGECELGGALMTVTSVRQEFIDFSTSFVQTGLGFIMHAPASKGCIFCFLLPFSFQVWMLIFVTAIWIALAISCLNKFSPFDYHGVFIFAQHNINRANLNRGRQKQFHKAYKTATSELNISNAFWFSFSSVFQQGCQLPLSLSGLTLTMCYWFAIMMLTSLYTANLASILTTAGLAGGIESVTDLANQEHIAYGTIRDSSVHSFFQETDVTIFARMYSWMRKHPNVGFVKNESTAIMMTRTTNFAFIWEKAIMDFLAQMKPCNLVSVGDPFNRIIFAWPLPKFSPYKEEISIIVSQLKEQGIVNEMMNKWFYGRSECPNVEIARGLHSTTTDDMIGVFLIIFVLMLLGTGILLIELGASCVNLIRSDIGKEKSINALGGAVNYRIKRIKRDWNLYYNPFTVRKRLPRKKNMLHAEKKHR